MIQQAVKRVKIGERWMSCIPMASAFLVSALRSNGFACPIGASMVCAAGKEYMPGVAFGALLGYLLPIHGETSIPMACSILLLLLLRLPWKKGSMTKKDRILWSVMCGAMVFLPFSVYSAILHSTWTSIAIQLSLAVVAGGITYLTFDMDVVMMVGSVSLSSLSVKMRYGLMLYAILAVAALMNVSLGPVCIGRMVGGGAVMAAGVAFGGIGGALSGLALAMAMLIPAWKGLEQSLCIAFASLGTGIFGKDSKLFALISWTLFYSILCGPTIGIPAALAESLGGSLILWLVPLQKKKVEKEKNRDLRVSVDGRLQTAGNALNEVANMVGKVAEHLRRSGQKTIPVLIDEAQDRVCRTCKRKMSCFGEDFSSMDSGFIEAGKVLEKKGGLMAADFPGYFSCDRKEEMSRVLSQLYREMKQEEKIHGVSVDTPVNVTGELKAVTGLVEDLRRQLGEMRCPDRSMEGLVITALAGMGLHPLDVECFRDKNDRVTVSCRLGEAIPTDQLLTTVLSDTCSRRFCAPIVSCKGGETTLTFCEEAVLKVTAGGMRVPKKGNRYCGDDFTSFSTEDGFFHGIISDGMGSGDMAAIDGSMTCTLIAKLMKAGFSADSALHLANTSLMGKGGEESFATLDLCSIDCFTGEADFCKGGAVPTLILRTDSIDKIESPSLPLGILPRVECAWQNATVSPGNMIAMMSDGVWAAGENNVRRVLIRGRELPASLLSRELIRMATAAGVEDDMTALILKVEENEGEK